MRIGSLALGLFLTLTHAGFGQYADLSGRIVLDAPLVADQPRSPALTVNPKNRGIADAFVYIRKPTAVNPALAAVPGAPAVITATEQGFVPHAMVVRCRQQIVGRNSDDEPSHVIMNGIANPPIGATVASNDPLGIPAEGLNRKPEPLPVSVTCAFNTDRRAYWLIVDHPYAAVTDKDGRFTIPRLPVGMHEVTIWHSTCGYLAKAMQVEVTAEGTTLEPLQASTEVIDGNAKLVRPE